LLYIGTTLAIFKRSGKTPLLNDKLIICNNGSNIHCCISLINLGPILSGPGDLLLLSVANKFNNTSYNNKKFKFLASSIVQVFMSSLGVMLLVSSQLDTYIAEVQDGDTLSVFEFWHARCPSRVALHGLRRTLYACIADLCGTHVFCKWAAPFWR